MSDPVPETTDPETNVQRMSDARHEYNNIAAIVSLSRKPAVLKQARVLWEAFRALYPDYTEDPDGLAEILADV